LAAIYQDVYRVYRAIIALEQSTFLINGFMFASRWNSELISVAVSALSRVQSIERATSRDYVHATFETTLMTLRTSLMIMFDVISLTSFNKMIVVFVSTQLPGLQTCKVVAV